MLLAADEEAGSTTGEIGTSVTRMLPSEAATASVATSLGGIAREGVIINNNQGKERWVNLQAHDRVFSSPATKADSKRAVTPFAATDKGYKGLKVQVVEAWQVWKIDP